MKQDIRDIGDSTNDSKSSNTNNNTVNGVSNDNMKGTSESSDTSKISEAIRAINTNSIRRFTLQELYALNEKNDKRVNKEVDFDSLDIHNVEAFVSEMGYRYSEVYEKLVKVLEYAPLISSAYIINGSPYLRIYIHRPSRLGYLEKITYAKDVDMLNTNKDNYINQINREAMMNIVNTRNFIELIINNSLFGVVKDEFNKRLLTVCLNLSEEDFCPKSIKAFRYIFVEEDANDDKIIESIAFNVDVLVNLIHLMKNA